jgi:transposase
MHGGRSPLSSDIESSDEDHGVSQGYSSAMLSPEVRDMLSLLHENIGKVGISKLRFRNFLTEIGVHVPTSTFYHWKRVRETRPSVNAEEKLSGKNPILDSDDLDRLKGFVVVRSQTGELIDVHDVVKFCEEELSVRVSIRTAQRYLKKLGFTYKEAQKRTAGWSHDHVAMADTMLNWLKSDAYPVFKAVATSRSGDLNRSRICSIDFTFTSSQKFKMRGYAAKGQ